MVNSDKPRKKAVISDGGDLSARLLAPKLPTPDPVTREASVVECEHQAPGPAELVLRMLERLKGEGGKALWRDSDGMFM